MQPWVVENWLRGIFEVNDPVSPGSNSAFSPFHFQTINNHLGSRQLALPSPPHVQPTLAPSAGAIGYNGNRDLPPDLRRDHTVNSI